MNGKKLALTGQEIDRVFLKVNGNSMDCKKVEDRTDGPQPPQGPESELPELDLELDVNDAVVDVIDGVVIEGDDEEIRLLFYHHKPNGIDLKDEVIRCKCVSELRITRSSFLPMTMNLNRMAKSLVTRQTKIVDCANQQKLPMYV